MTDNLAETIKNIRTSVGDTPAAAAKKVGVSRQGYLKWELGDTKNMKLGNLIMFCDAYHVGIEALIRGSLSISQTPPANDGEKYPKPAPVSALVAAESNPEIRMVVEGFLAADEGLRRAILALARESIAVFEKRSEQNK